jgi:type I restriction enzyme, R subunit
MRAALVNEAGQRAIERPKYVVRITGDSAYGKAELDNFIDPESQGNRVNELVTKR